MSSIDAATARQYVEAATPVAPGDIRTSALASVAAASSSVIAS